MIYYANSLYSKNKTLEQLIKKYTDSEIKYMYIEDLNKDLHEINSDIENYSFFSTSKILVLLMKDKKDIESMIEILIKSTIDSNVLSIIIYPLIEFQIIDKSYNKKINVIIDKPIKSYYELYDFILLKIKEESLPINFEDKKIINHLANLLPYNKCIIENEIGKLKFLISQTNKINATELIDNYIVNYQNSSKFNISNLFFYKKDPLIEITKILKTYPKTEITDLIYYLIYLFEQYIIYLETRETNKSFKKLFDAKKLSLIEILEIYLNLQNLSTSMRINKNINYYDLLIALNLIKKGEI